MTEHGLFAFSSEQINEKVAQAGEAEFRIDVVLNHVKGKVIKAAKAPDAQTQEK